MTSGDDEDSTEIETEEPAITPEARATPRATSGRYHQGRELGVGGMGRVVESADRYLGRVVARKTLLASQSGRARARFLREVRIQAQLEHPAIVPVYELDVEGELPSFTMKRIRGVTLRQAIRAGRETGDATFAPRRLLSAFARVCLAVDYAHRRGVVHRDLKPSNIMLGDFGEIYVLDWGVASIDADAAPDGPLALGPGSHSQETQRAGTRGYMAPEVALGATPGDARSDVFSLGAILFEIVAGERAAAPAGSEVAASIDASARARELGVSVAPELLAICDRALAPADHRFENPRALHDAIEAYLDGDRDLALRRETADSLIRSALTRLELGRVGDQRPAMRDLLAALALAPTHERALRALQRLLAEPPREVPPEVTSELAALDDRRLAAMATPARRTAVFGIPAVIAAALAMGVRDIGLFVTGCVAAVVLGVAVGVEGWLAARRTPSTRPRRWRRDIVPLVLLATGVGGFAIIAGPFVLVPALATAVAMIRVLRDPRQVWLVVTLLLLAFTVPLALEVGGFISPSYELGAGVWTIHPRVVAFPRLPTIALGLVTSTAVVAGAAAIAVRFRRELEAVELRNYLYSWRLEQLVPELDHPRPDPAAERSSRA